MVIIINKWEKEVQKSLLDSEEATLAELQKQYNRALRDIGQKVKAFQVDIDMLDAALESDNLDDAARQRLLSQKRSKVYQKQYQEALQGQISGILDQMQGNNFTTIEAYLKQTYEDAYIGTMYDIHNQGVPIITPIDQAAAVKAVLTDSKISKGLYTALGMDIARLKKSISAEITRGIASSLSYADIARNLNNVSRAGYSNAKRIVVTEGHRIQQTSANDARKAAKSKGADVVKQWDAALDGKTRPNHRQLDGQIREVDEPFEVGGMKAMFPGDFGDPAEDCNCRCTADTRARWALDEDELQTLKDRADYFGLDKTKDFGDFREKYLNISAEPLENKAKSSKINAGAVTGAYSNKNDPDGKKREAHAERYYESIRNSNKKDIVATISENSGSGQEYVSKMYDHLFINKYELDKGHAHFDPDYEIAESIQRLREGKNIQNHDRILIYHEAMEHDLMNVDGLGYEDAHELANRAFNYQKALEKWLDETEK